MKPETKAKYAVPLWAVLVSAAREGRTMSYEEASQLIGLNNAQNVGRPLKPIQNYCTREGLPRLTSIIVLADTGLPGGGYDGDSNKLKEDHKKVFKHSWGASPSMAEFENCAE